MSRATVPAVGLGVLTRWCPPEVVDKAIDTCERREQRCRALPARMMVYFELARCLYPHLGYDQVLRHLIPPEAEQDGPWRIPNKSSLCRARRKLGPVVLEELFHQIAGPLAEEATCPAAFWRGLRLEAFDGTSLAVADTPANATVFGRKGANIPEGHGYPQVELAVLTEVGTRAVIDAALGGREDNEITLARRLATSAGPGTLVLADRNMVGVELWHAFTRCGADLLWRLRPAVARRRLQELADGSYLAAVQVGSHRAKRHRRADRSIPARVTVRVIEYHLNGSREAYRLATSLLDPQSAPAVELAALYQQRWEAETGYAELKTVQRGAGVVLRSAHPDGVRQEAWAQLIVHRLTRALIQDIACATVPPTDPDCISFPRAQEAVRRRLSDPLFPL